MLRIFTYSNVPRSLTPYKYVDVGSATDTVCSIGYSDTGKVYLQVNKDEFSGGQCYQLFWSKAIEIFQKNSMFGYCLLQLKGNFLFYTVPPKNNYNIEH